MRLKIAVLALALLVAGCQAKSDGAQQEVAAVKIDTAADVAKAFAAAGLPVKDLVVLDASSDTNHLLGRPGQYASKVMFFDARHPKPGPDDDTGENTIEVFADPAAAKARHDYIDGIAKSAPIFAQYLVLNGKVLARFDKVLLPAEVDAYKAALAKAVGPS